MTIIGETTDDAVGEAFDKSKILGLPYPAVL
jgi:N6-L-threonylcarbamoyladenine synthase